MKKVGLARLKSLTLFNLVFILLFVLTTSLVSLAVFDVMRKQALAEAESKARILLNQNLAIHSFYTEILKPQLFEFTDSFRPDSYFDPSWMSSSYAVRQIGKRFKDINQSDFYGDYYIKDAAFNARSPENEADEIELAFLRELRSNSELVMRTSTRTIDGIPYMQYLRRGEVLADSCIQCHGDPDQAPAGLVDIYGPSRSFNRQAEIGEVVSVISIRVPLAASFAMVERFSLHLSGVLLTLLAGLFLVQYWVSKRLFYAPIALIRDMAIKVATDEDRLGEQVPLPFGLEWRKLAEAFNTMSMKLRQDRDTLEDRIQERTTALESAKRCLEDDIEERVQVEKALKEAIAENVNLLGELQHRAKNSFTLISSLVYLTANADSSEETREVLETLAARVKSISELYSLLYASGSTSEVRLDEYCLRIAQPLIALSEVITFKSALAACTLPVKLAAPVGLILNELVTNAIKYAFPGPRIGSMTLGLEQTAEGIRLEVSDDGIGLPTDLDPVNSSGKGLKLVYALVNQIDGHLVAQRDVTGTRWVLEFPV